MTDFNEFVDKVKRETDIVEIIGEYVPSLKRAGKNYKGLCPFHKEKTPSFSINPAGQFYHCFGCGANGDAIKFIQQIEAIDFKDAVGLLAQRRNIPVPEFRRGSGEERKNRQQLKQTLYELHDLAQGLYEKELKNSSLARQYCADRGLTPEIVDRFGIGYVSDEWSFLVERARKKGYSDEALLESGLALRSEKSGNIYDRFRGRITFPIHNPQKRIVAFGGRLLHDIKEQPKYLNSSDSPIYQKGRLLYGFHLAQADIRERNCALICEGYTDLIALHNHGFTNAVANLGTAFAEDQGRLLQRVCREAIFLYDGDEAGQKAMLRATLVLLPLEFRIRIVTFDADDDPDSFLRREGAEGLRARLDEAVDYLDFFLDSAARQEDPNSAHGKAAIVKKMSELLGTIKNPILAQDAVRRIAEYLKIEEGLVHRSLSKKSARAQTIEEELEQREAVPVSEAQLLRLMVEHETVRRNIGEELNADWLSSDLTRFWVMEIIRLTREDAEVTAQSLNAGQVSADERQMGFLRETLMEEAPPVSDFNALCRQILGKLQVHYNRRRARTLRMQLSQSENSDPSKLKPLVETLANNGKERKRIIDNLYKPNLSMGKK